MQNAAIAAVFDEIADYMELAGENSFKIRAYRRAAEAVATFPDDIEAASENDALREIEGLGEATQAKVKEFLATGKMRYHDWLREKYPSGLLDLIRVPGLGPKRVAQLHAERGIDSLESLKAALQSGALDGVKGLGPSTLKNIGRGLERMAQMTKRLPLGDALPIANGFMRALSTPETRVEITGSVRRGCDTVGDINLIAATEDASQLIEKFVALPQALAISSRDETSAAIRVRPGIEVRLRTSTPQTFGADLFFSTGSKSHLEAAQKLAAEKNLDLKAESAFADETEIFRALGAQFIAPELRENKGEWDAALKNALPNLVEEKNLRGDLHTHSTWSDGAVSIRQMAEAMRERGYEYFAVTDHSKALAMANGLNAARLREQAKEIEEAQAEFPDIKILRGVECDIMRDGSLDLDDEILHELDIVVASVHSAFNLDEAAMTARIIKAVSHPAVDILAHPTGRVLGVRPPYDVNMNAVIEAARATNTSLEINSSERLDLKDEHAFAAREAGVLLSIDSDAHSPRMLPNVSFGDPTARRAWCESKDVLNAKSKDELLKWLNRAEAKR